MRRRHKDKMTRDTIESRNGNEKTQQQIQRIHRTKGASRLRKGTKQTQESRKEGQRQTHT